MGSFFLLFAEAKAQGFIVDHTSTDLSQIPETWINHVKSTLKVHYAHTSHGEQIYTGLDRLSKTNNQYAFYPDNCMMPVTTAYLSMMEGQYLSDYCETYVTPEYYWEGTSALNITRGMLNTHDINISMWAWCSHDRNADWWVAVTTPFAYPGNWYSYVYPTGWHEGINLCIQNPIFDLSSFEIMNSALPPGNYRFYFVVDDPDGVALGPWWDSDWVDVQVTQ